jgi:hypothetical protein
VGLCSSLRSNHYKMPSTIAEEKTLGRGKGLSIVRKENRKAICQGLSEEAKKQIALIYLPGTMAYIKEHDKALCDEVFVA